MALLLYFRLHFTSSVAGSTFSCFSCNDRRGFLPPFVSLQSAHETETSAGKSNVNTGLNTAPNTVASSSSGFESLPLPVHFCCWLDSLFWSSSSSSSSFTRRLCCHHHYHQVRDLNLIWVLIRLVSSSSSLPSLSPSVSIDNCLLSFLFPFVVSSTHLYVFFSFFINCHLKLRLVNACPCHSTCFFCSYFCHADHDHSSSFDIQKIKCRSKNHRQSVN